jgi:hypothetical protein
MKTTEVCKITKNMFGELQTGVHFLLMVTDNTFFQQWVTQRTVQLNRVQATSSVSRMW